MKSIKSYTKIKKIIAFLLVIITTITAIPTIGAEKIIKAATGLTIIQSSNLQIMKSLNKEDIWYGRYRFNIIGASNGTACNEGYTGPDLIDVINQSSSTRGNGAGLLYYNMQQDNETDSILLFNYASSLKEITYNKTGYTWAGYNSNSNKSYDTNGVVEIQNNGYTRVSNKGTNLYLDINDANGNPIASINKAYRGEQVVSCVQSYYNGKLCLEMYNETITNWLFPKKLIVDPAGDGYVYLRAIDDETAYLRVWPNDENGICSVGMFSFYESESDYYKWKFEDITEILTPAWTPIDYNITYNLDGGTVSGNPETYNIETETFTLNNPTKAGYTFIGWTGSNGTIPETSVTITKGSTGNRNYTANWKPIQYYVSYTKGLTNQNLNMPSTTTHTYNLASKLARIGNLSNGGRTYLISFDSNKGTGSTTPTTISSRSGSLTFKSWKINNIEYDSEGNIVNLTDKDNITLTAEAQWSSKTENDFENVTRPGYIFNGWFDTATGGNKVTEITIIPSTIAYSKQLYAQWVPINYSVSFNSNKPNESIGKISGSMSNQSFKYDTSQNLTTNKYTLSGYSFIGWNTKADGTGISYIDGQMANNLTTENNQSITLFAQWKDNSPEDVAIRTEISEDNVISISKTVHLYAKDSGSGIAAYYFGKISNPSDDNYVGITPTQEFKLDTTVTEEGIYYLWVKDVNNNKTYTSIVFYKTSFDENHNNIVDKNGKVLTDTSFTSKPNIMTPSYSINISGSTISPTNKRAGVTFMGMSKNADSSTGLFSINVIQDSTYYCIWKDNIAPTIILDGFTSNNDTKQTIYFSLYDTSANSSKTGSDIKGYYFGTSTNPTDNTFKPISCDNTNGYALKLSETISIENSYYIFAVDKAGNISDCIVGSDGTNGVKLMKVTYNTNGTKNSPAYLKNNHPSYNIYVKGTVIAALPVSTRVGYHDSVTGQLTMKDKTNHWYLLSNPNTKFTTYTVNENAEIYAAWEANKFNINVNYNKPTTASSALNKNGDDNISVSYDSSIGILPVPTMIGWDFNYWYENDTGAKYVDGIIYKYNNDISISAKWTEQNRIITYNTNKPENASSDVIIANFAKTVKYDNPVGALIIPELTGWKFDGWFVTDNNGNEVNVTENTKYDYDLSGGNNIILTAHWTPIKYEVRLNANKPDNATAILIASMLPGWTSHNYNNEIYYSKTFTYDSAQDIPNCKNIYNLKGWTAIKWVSDSAYVSEILNINSPYGGNIKWNFTAVDNDIIILDAYWIMNHYTINYDSRGGTSIDSNKNIGYENWTSINGKSNRPGYKFIEWNTEPDGSGISFEAEQSVRKLESENKSITLYAIWEKGNPIVIQSSNNSVSFVNSLAGNIDETWVNSEETILQEWTVTKDNIEIIFSE